jgi:hypothetical protein
MPLNVMMRALALRALGRIHADGSEPDQYRAPRGKS